MTAVMEWTLSLCIIEGDLANLQESVIHVAKG